MGMTEGQRAALALDEAARFLRAQAATCKGHSYSGLLDGIADQLEGLYAAQVGPPTSLRLPS